MGKKHTVILSTHILSEVQAVCERIIIIDKGKIIANEQTSEITRAIEDNNRFKVKICGDRAKVLSALRDRSGIVKVEEEGSRDSDSALYIVETERGIDVRKTVFYACAENNLPILEFAPAGAELEDVFLKLVDKGQNAKKER